MWSNVDIGGIKTNIIEYSCSYIVTKRTIIPVTIPFVIIVFSVENKLSYKTAQHILAKISQQYYKQTFGNMPPVLLYGNKTDAIERKITSDEVLLFLAENQYSNVVYKETSLKLNDKQSVVEDIRTVFKL